MFSGPLKKLGFDPVSIWLSFGNADAFATNFLTNKLTFFLSGTRIIS